MAVMLASTSAMSATHEIVELGTIDRAKNFAGTGINNNSVTLGVASGVYHYPVDTTALDYDSIEASLEAQGLTTDDVFDDYEAIKEGNITTANDLSVLVANLAANPTDLTVQQLGGYLAVRFDPVQAEWVVINDVEHPDVDDFTYSTDDTFNAINDDDWMAGYASMPYIKTEYELTEDNDNTGEQAGDIVTYFLRDYERRAIVERNGTKIELEAPYNDFGGYSVATDITDGKVVVGYASTGIVQDRQDALDNCDEFDVPLQACFWNTNYGFKQKLAPGSLPDYPFDWPIFDVHAYMWKLDDGGNIIEQKDLGILATTDDFDDDQKAAFSLRSMALAVNENEVAVGYSDVHFRDETDNPNATFQHAVVYKDDEVLRVGVDEEEYFASFLYDINDNGIAVGHAFKQVNGFNRSKFFYVDTTDESLTPVFPEDFFPGSASTGRAINNNNQIVGEFEVEAQITSTRRRHGFMYDIEADTFTDINTFLTCDIDYSVVEARGINDAGEIVGSITFGTDARDSFGDLATDDDGVQLRESVTRAVKLIPTGGSIDDCRIEEVKNERSGATFSMLWLMFISAFAAIRRRVKKG